MENEFIRMCDKCEELYDIRNTAKYPRLEVVNCPSVYIQYPLSLCPKCMGLLHKWVKPKKPKAPQVLKKQLDCYWGNGDTGSFRG